MTTGPEHGRSFKAGDEVSGPPSSEVDTSQAEGGGADAE